MPLQAFESQQPVEAVGSRGIEFDFFRPIAQHRSNISCHGYMRVGLLSIQKIGSNLPRNGDTPNSVSEYSRYSKREHVESHKSVPRPELRAPWLLATDDSKATSRRLYRGILSLKAAILEDL